MSEPTVCAIMLTRDRPELARKAVECFRAQTYPIKSLLVWDTSVEMKPGKRLEVPREWLPDIQYAFYGPQEYSIGELRNNAIQYGASEVVCTVGSDKELIGAPDVLIHWDDDDWSSPNRIAEQVELLQTSGADVVGYNDMLFWRSAGIGRDGQSWLYTVIPGLVPALGTSLCYWRKTWEKQKFANAPGPQGGSEYGAWLKGLNVKTAPSVQDEPRMIARIHAGNASRHAYNLEHWVKYQGTPVTWKRVPEWDERVGRILG